MMRGRRLGILSWNGTALEYPMAEATTVIPAAGVDRVRHSATVWPAYLFRHELLVWQNGEREPVSIESIGKVPRDAIAGFATAVAEARGVDPLEIGPRWTVAIIYLLAIVLPFLVGLGFVMAHLGDLGWWAFAMVPVAGAMGFLTHHIMKGRWPPRRARSVETFLAILPKS